MQRFLPARDGRIHGITKRADPTGEYAIANGGAGPRETHGDVSIASAEIHVVRIRDQLDSQVGELGEQRRQGGNKYAIDKHRHGGHSYAATHGGIHALDDLAQASKLCLDYSRAFDHHFTGFSRAHLTVRRALKEFRVQSRLDGTQPPRDRRRIGVQASPGCGVGTVAGDRQNVLKIVPVEGRHFCSLDRRFSTLKRQ
uniref:Uncharacterized protein n=1 Tax=Paraburkholderia sprentiae WSM5005 TaxID=754502 RepID=A0A1I9YTZ5_9BURK